MKCQFALFTFQNTRAQHAVLKIFQPSRRHPLDAGFELPEQSTPEVYVDYLQPLMEYQQLPPFALLKFFEHQAQFYLYFCPLACPSPTSLKSGKYYYQCFDSLLGIPYDNFSMILGNAIHYTIYRGLFDEKPEEVFDAVYYGYDLFLENQEQDYLYSYVREYCIQLCKEYITRFRGFGCDIVNEKHVISQALGLQGKIDIYGASSEMYIVIELKTRSTPFNKEDHNKQLALYVYESLEHCAPRLYCEVIGVLQDSGGLYFPNRESAALRESFFNYNEKKHRQLLNFLNLLIMDRNIYILSHFLLLCYIQNTEERKLIASLFSSFVKRYGAAGYMSEVLSIVDNLLTPCPIYREELLCLQSRIRQLLSLDLHYAVVDDYLRAYNCENATMKHGKQVGLLCTPSFYLARQSIWRVFGERFQNGYFEYDVMLVNGDATSGKYRLFEIENDGTVRRCQIFCSLSQYACRSTSKLDCGLSYLALQLAYYVFRGVGLFNASEPRIVQYAYWQTMLARGAYNKASFEANVPSKRLLVSEITAGSYLREFKFTGDHETDRYYYYAYLKACIVVGFDDFVAKQVYYSERGLFVDTKLSDTQLAYCVLSRPACFLGCGTKLEFEQALGRLRSSGVKIINTSRAAFEAEHVIDLTAAHCSDTNTSRKGPKVLEVIDID